MSSDTTFNVYFNSGLGLRENSFTNGSNVTKISISNSDQDFYQNGILEIYNCSQQNVGDDVDVYINDLLEFSGYVARRQIHHKAGTTLYTYQLIGKTYDLWRFRTGQNELCTGYSSFIASSLVSKYCYPTVYGNSNTSDGYEFINSLDLSDIPVGDALVALIGYDGFKFYVDNDRSLVYYNPSGIATNTIRITEEEILDMSPVEEADEDLVNDILVIGGSGYSQITSVPIPTGKTTSQVSSAIFKPNMYIAQKFKPKDGVLSAIKLLLDRTVEPNSPSTPIYCEILEKSQQAKIFF